MNLLRYSGGMSGGALFTVYGLDRVWEGIAL
jgi:hypothetical protein